MKQVLNTLYEIEESADQIMSDAAAQKERLAETYHQTYEQYKSELTKQYEQKLSEHKAQLNEQKEQELKKIRDLYETQISGIKQTTSASLKTMTQKILDQILAPVKL